MPNPYKGLFQYTSKDEDDFFGREQETQELVNLIQNKQVVTIYGASGAGKTSLINARLFPKLLRIYYLPVYIRINYVSDIPPIVQVKQIVYNELKKIDKDLSPLDASTTLITYAAKTSIFQGLIKPVLFFDQFEELFTLGIRYQKKAALVELITELADLIEVRMDALQLAGKDVILDKLTENEEQQLAQNISNFKTVISLRQDYVVYLDDLKIKIPSLLYGKYRLKKFSVQQAIQAITGPFRNFATANTDVAYELSDSTVQLIIEQLTASHKTKRIESPREDLQQIRYLDDNYIDPTVLSLYCYELFVETAASSFGKETPDYDRLMQNTIEKNSLPFLVEKYYKRHIRNDNRLKRQIEKMLVTEDGRRLLVPVNEFTSRTRITERSIMELINSSALLRIYGAGESRELEIAHDQIAKQVLASRKLSESGKVKRNIIGAGFLVVIFFTSIVYISFENKLSETYSATLEKRIVLLEKSESGLKNSLLEKENLLAALNVNFESAKSIRKLLTDSIYEARSLQRKAKAQLDNAQDELLKFREYKVATIKELSKDKRVVVDTVKFLSEKFGDENKKLNQKITDYKKNAKNYEMLMDDIKKRAPKPIVNMINSQKIKIKVIE